LAFEEDLGYDPSQPPAEDYTLSATGLVSKTLSLWTRKLVQYIIIVGIVSVVLTLVSFVILATFFEIIGVLETDFISYLFSIFALPSIPEMPLIVISLAFGVVAFVINAILIGAAIKFALNDYGGLDADIGTSFSHGRTSRIIIVQLVTTLITSAVIAPSLILLGRAMEGIDISDPFNPIITPEAIQLMLMSMVLLLVGGLFVLYISVRFAPALAIVVDTDLSAIDSLKKSWEITSGNVLHVLGGQILIALVIGLLALIVGMGLTVVLFLNPYAIVLEVVITSLLFSALNLVFIAVLYRDLMSRTTTSDLPEYVL